jgi:hypothetical protein
MAQSIVIDSNVVVGLSMESAGLVSRCSAPPSQALVAIESDGSIIYLDEQGHVLAEWEAGCDPDWFFDFASNHDVRYIFAKNYTAFCREARVKFGFPKLENVWILRIALTVVETDALCLLLTEDVDFYSPKKKLVPAVRKRLIAGRVQGDFQKRLKKERVLVRSVGTIANDL